MTMMSKKTTQSFIGAAALVGGLALQGCDGPCPNFDDLLALEASEWAEQSLETRQECYNCLEEDAGVTATDLHEIEEGLKLVSKVHGRDSVFDTEFDRNIRFDKYIRRVKDSSGSVESLLEAYLSPLDPDATSGPDSKAPYQAVEYLAGLDQYNTWEKLVQYWKDNESEWNKDNMIRFACFLVGTTGAQCNDYADQFPEPFLARARDQCGMDMTDDNEQTITSLATAAGWDFGFEDSE